MKQVTTVKKKKEKKNEKIFIIVIIYLICRVYINQCMHNSINIHIYIHTQSMHIQISILCINKLNCMQLELFEYKKKSNNKKEKDYTESIKS